MRVIAELIGRVFKEDPRKKELDGLVSTFKEQVEGLLGESDTSYMKIFLLDSEKARQLAGPWETPVTIAIRIIKGGFRLDIWSEVFGEALELENNKPRFLDTSSISGYWEKPKEGGDLGTKILRMQEWIRRVTVLEGLQKNPQTAFPAPIAT